jgi:hypothetical protein
VLFRSSEQDVEEAFGLLGKQTREQRMHNCYACGSETCRDMAVRIAKGINIPENCIEKSRHDLLREHQAYMDEKLNSVDKISHIYTEVEEIKKLFAGVLAGVTSMSDAIEQYNKMAKLINDISLQTQILSINASIEASNAGAAGKGFAVISSAIRDLATKSGTATSEIEETSSRTAMTIGSIRRDSEAVDESILTVCNYIDEITASISAAGIERK